MKMSYQGPATVIADGAEVSVKADLQIHQEPGGMTSWDGSLQADPSVDFWDADETRLRMPDGREGAFIATRGVVGSSEVEIQGSGPAPF
ncbi:DUF4873 domain-containing protein [Streptomyces sp. NPDC002328]|uniref:DUF4873 domain-containing protein n=1 Tax=Streptomyces sp. NPDC002328 TaxID=3364642 RepID=UPI003688363B